MKAEELKWKIRDFFNHRIKLKNVIIVSTILLLIGVIVGITHPKRRCPKCKSFAMTPDEACKTFFNCSYGWGNTGNLHCNCNGSWKVFGYNDLPTKKSREVTTKYQSESFSGNETWENITIGKVKKDETQ